MPSISRELVIYAVFDRKQVYRELRRAGGRFTRALLGLLIWQQHSDDGWLPAADDCG